MIFTLALGWLKKTLFGNPLGMALLGIVLVLFAVILIPNIGQISERLGFESRATLKEKLAVEKINTDTAVDANASLVTAVAISDKTTENTVKAINNLNDNNKVTDVKTTDIVKKKNSNIARVKAEKKEVASVDDPIQLKMATKLEEERISTYQVLAIWEAYCQFNVDETCKNIEKG